MKMILLAAVTGLMAFFLFEVAPARSGQASDPAPENRHGYLEIECNMADVDLYACPRNQFERKTIRKFFGLATSYRESCSGGALFLGTTPVSPVELPDGLYVLQLPPGYVWEHEGPIEIGITAGEKTFLPLKLFRRHEASGEGVLRGPGSPSGSGGTGSGSGGAPGSPSGSGGTGSGSGGAPGSPPP